jgi:HD-like signal output (HDOD) protein
MCATALEELNLTIPALSEQEVVHRVLRVTGLPAMPVTLLRLIEVLREEDVSQREIESLIRYDEALSARVLRVANSVFYGYRRKVLTISRAIPVIGLEQIRSICLFAFYTDFVSKDKALSPSEREKLWKHAFVTAKAAGMIARQRPWVSADEAFILGLLHDMGRYLMAVEFGEQYRLIMEMSTKRQVPVRYVELECGLRHDLIGKWLAIKWSLPEVFQTVMEYHHAPEKSPSSKREVMVIALADILANARDYPALLTDPFTTSYRQELLIVEDEWEDYGSQMDGIWSEANQFWRLLSRKE